MMADGEDLAGRGRLAGKVALVTGCGRPQGIGRAVALDLAAAGADVAVTDLLVEGVRNVADASEAEQAAGWRGLNSLVEELQAMDRRAVALTGDISEEADAERMVAEAIAALGRVDILVNNAGAPHGPDRGTSWEIPIAAFDAVMRINTRGGFLMSRAVIRHLLARREAGEAIAGRIITIASGAGKRGVPERAAYCASKFAAIGLTQTLAQELGAMDITVNAVCPGAIATARAASREKRKAEAGVSFEFMKSAVPRIGTGHDIARAVTFLAEPEASFVTGQSIMVDGGMLML
jgi:NAD(P)-dependent dehydrogenase (short-subunit alcohol dehydrogenase family)